MPKLRQGNVTFHILRDVSDFWDVKHSPNYESGCFSEQILNW